MDTSPVKACTTRLSPGLELAYAICEWKVPHQRSSVNWINPLRAKCSLCDISGTILGETPPFSPMSVPSPTSFFEIWRSRPCPTIRSRATRRSGKWFALMGAHRLLLSSNLHNSTLEIIWPLLVLAFSPCQQSLSVFSACHWVKN